MQKSGLENLLANAEMQTAAAAICRAAGFEPPVICTPEELLGS